MLASTPDLLRLVAVPVLGWAAWRDVRTRRVPNRTWVPLVALGVVLLAWEFAALWPVGPGDGPYLLRVAASLGVVAPLAYLFWRLGGFGGADAKAFIALAVLVPTYPTYYLSTMALPRVEATVGVFSLTVLTNTVVVGMGYPLVLAGRNLLAGERSPAMLLARRVDVGDVPSTHGRLFETREGFTRTGLDLDALRMYLRWRGTTLAAVRDAPAGHRDPASVTETFPPTDGAVGLDSAPLDHDAAGPAASDGRSDGGANREPGRQGEPGGGRDGAVPGGPAGSPDAEADPDADSGAGADPGPEGGRPPDPWGAAAFVEAVDGRAYGATAESLREGLELVVARERVWVSPGIPFIVPTFVGLVLAFTYGDLLVGLLAAVGGV
jgi:preflagellin peptidase FlaK